jgi:hypothetical protein
VSYCCPQCDGTRAEYAAQQREREARRGKARELLAHFLTPTQRRSYTRYDSFRVRGSCGTLYRINTDDYVGNVEWLDSRGHSRGELCAHSASDARLPVADHHLAQMLELVTDELRWLDIACLMSGDYPEIYYEAYPGRRFR